MSTNGWASSWMQEKHGQLTEAEPAAAEAGRREIERWFEEREAQADGRGTA
ncbi:hypothetical protein ACIQM3_01695 [Streptomyces sp. NPDC091271]|uniref:hypothetical protein n=1 Tax=Streptomyces sp. NPDC091271 TaxID=3365980 RepID=UPI0037FDD32C